MNVTTPSPSRLLKMTAVTARWLLGLLIAAWLVFALSVVVLHAWIVPRIADYRGALEQQASKAIGAPVRIGSITAESKGLFPTIELRDVVLQDAQQRDALRLARVVASVSPRSLWHLSFEQLYIDRPEAEVRLDAAGRLHVAGLDLSKDGGEDTRSADWFFSQREFVVERGTVRWTDEKRGAPPLLLGDVRFVSRNSARRHLMRLDATPPAGWGDRFTVQGDFRQPLLSVRRGNWQSWDGQLYAELPRIDVTRLGQYVTLDARIREGNGALRAWVDVDDGRPVGGAADLGLARVNAVLGESLEPLVLSQVTGRLAVHSSADLFAFSTRDLQFTTGSGMRWPGGNLWFQRVPAKGRTPESGAFRADRLDLGALALIANRLPIGDEAHRVIAARAPRGLVEGIDVTWQGPLETPRTYQARGRVTGLSLASSVDASTPAARIAQARPPVGVPGVRGLDAEFEMTQAGGTASLAMANGALDLPGVFEDPVLPLAQFSGRLRWKRDGERIELTLPDLRFANADAQGAAELAWRTSDPAKSGSKSRFPGVLDLKGQLTRADGTRVWRYLPMDIPKDVRDYVRDAVTKGEASGVDFRLRGDLWDMPFLDPKQGEFRIAAKVHDVHYAYVPHEAGGKPSAWPPLTALSGELVFDRASMQVNNARARIAGATAVEMVKGEARIPNLDHGVLQVDAQARGPLGDVLRVGAPLLGDARDFVAGVRATGGGDYRLKLELPLDAMDKAKVQAGVVLADNELRLAPEAPPLTQARGTLSFTESGFSLAGVQARFGGGDVRVEGKGRYSSAGQDFSLRATGNVTADGLRAAREADWLARLARQMQGGTTYTASFGMRDETPEFSLESSLQGLALDLPAPLGKAAGDSLPLHIAQTVLRRDREGRATRDQFEMTLGSAASAQYERELAGGAARVLRGAVRIGQAAVESGALPESGVLANIALPRVDVEAWRKVFEENAGSTQAVAPASEAEESAWVPTLVAIRAAEFAVAGRTLHDVVMGGTREGTLWRANIDARELSGYAEYRVQQAGRLYARLARLKIEPSEAKQVESLLDEEPGDLPALDVVVDDFELLGRKLGRAEIDAVNRGGATREWRLNKLALTTPEGAFSAQGSWAAAANAGGRAPRRTAMNFKLDIADAGALLERFGMKGVLARGKGELAGEVHWRGSPFSIDYPSLGGQMHLDMASGQFLKAEPGIAKLLGVLSLQALPRRLTLDFRDIFSAGFAFDFIRGDARIADGIATTNNLQMKGVNAAVLMDGSADIARETQNLRVVVVPEINAGTAALVATAINPAIGLGTFLAQMVLSKPLAVAATQEFQIDGTWADPRVTKVPRRVGSALQEELPKLPALPSLPALPGFARESSASPQENRP
ncbi:TIGR02099 family protein [Xenophilus aerolatus]|nr:TIGR02099 family protein [Xenophilus aerolatus]